jgi:hypothetical protein
MDKLQQLLLQYIPLSGNALELYLEDVRFELWRDASYPDRKLSWCSSVPTGKFRGRTWIRLSPLPSKSRPIRSSFCHRAPCNLDTTIVVK